MVNKFKGILVLTTPLVAMSCATSDNFADIIMPDEFGIGNTFISGSYRGIGSSRTTPLDPGRGSAGEEGVWAEDGNYSGDITSAWFVWKIPSFGDSDVSVRRIRENYSADNAAPPNSLMDITVDPETGSKSYSFGAGFYAAMISVISLLGLGAAKLKGVFSKGSSEGAAEIADAV